MSVHDIVEREEIAVQFVGVPGLEDGTLPGGRYLRARLRGDPPGVYERIGPTFDELVAIADVDRSRPGLEHYRRVDEIDLLLPINERRT